MKLTRNVLLTVSKKENKHTIKLETLRKQVEKDQKSGNSHEKD